MNKAVMSQDLHVDGKAQLISSYMPEAKYANDSKYFNKENK